MPRKRIRRLTWLLLLLLLIGAGVLFVPSLLRPTFPDEGDLELDLPTLRVPSAACYEAESRRMLLTTADYEEIELRLTWDPGDGQGRIRQLGHPRFPKVEPGLIKRLLAWVRGKPSPKDGAAALVVAGARYLENMPLPPPEYTGSARVYLGGLTADGKIGAVPFLADPEVLAWSSFGPMAPLPSDPERNRTIELRITREGDRVRYRWGPAAFLTSRDVGARFSGGDVTFPAEIVAGPGTGPLLPGLAERLTRRVPGKTPMLKVVLLEIGSGVRYVDILRAVECAPGDPKVHFQLFPSRQGTLEALTLPTPPAAGVSVLGEALDLGRTRRMLIVNVLPDGAIIVKKVEQTRDLLRENLAGFYPQDGCQLRVDRDIPFPSIVPILELLRGHGLEVYLCLAPLDPALRFEMVFGLPLPASGEAAIDVKLRRTDAGLEPTREDVAGRPVRVHVPEDAKLEETLHALIRLKLAGATGFEFE